MQQKKEEKNKLTIKKYLIAVSSVSRYRATLQNRYIYTARNGAKLWTNYY